MSWKNVLFTRPSYLDKVHHSVVSCISWSTLKELTLDHTKLFSTQVSEKILVELCGAGLKNCSQGWFMLSECEFLDMACCYLNMNHQKTSKFLGERDQSVEREISADQRTCKL